MTKILSRLYENPTTQLNKCWTSDTGVKKWRLHVHWHSMLQPQRKLSWNSVIHAQQQVRTPQPLNHCFRQWMVQWKKINWSKCVGFGVDNCHTNIACNNYMLTRILNENKNYFIVGCSCNLAHSQLGQVAEHLKKYRILM